MFYFPKYYNFIKVGLASLLASIGLLVFVYVYRLALGVSFNWIAYREYLLNQFFGTVATAVFFYYALNTFHGLFQQKKRLIHFVQPVLIGLIMVLLYNLAVDRLLPLRSNINNPLPLVNQIIGHLLVGLSFVSAAIIIAYVNHLRLLKKKQKLLEAQKLRLEVEKAQAELKFLKSQINPHFLHNTLNSFYARALPLSPELSEGILTLSEMMRYALEEPHAADGKVYLKDEIEHVRNLIKINQFRFRNNLRIRLEVTGELNGYLIIPFVIITLVENIFKHGDLSDAANPITIHIEIKDDRFRYYSSNRKTKGSKETFGGIGIDNIKKRLEFAYSEGYALNIHEDADFYNTELIIDKL